MGQAYDQDGQLALLGHPSGALVQAFTSLPFHRQPAPKSLGREWLDECVWPLFAPAVEEVSGSPVSASAKQAVSDALATATKAIAHVLADALSSGPAGNVLCTGGGSYNRARLDTVRVRLPSSHSLVVPDRQLIDYKEAIAFALLGALRMRGEVNALASVTGARRDSSGGELSDPAAALTSARNTTNA